MNGKMEQEIQIKQKIYSKLATLPTIFTEFYSYMEADQKSYMSIKHYIEYVSDFMDAVAHEETKDEFYKYVTIPEIREYIVSLRVRNDNGVETKNSDSIQATRWSALNAFFNFLVIDDYIDVNPMTKTKRPKNKTEKPIVYLDQDEIDSILNQIRKQSHPKMVNRDLAIVTLGVVLGVRVSALVQINIDDINFKDNTIYVIEKGNKKRYLQFGQNARTVLSSWLVDRATYFPDVETDALFISQWQQRLTVEGVRKLLKKYADGINGKHVTPHTMRKSTATNLAKAGVDIQTIAHILGHNSIETSRKYAAVLDENKQNATNVLDKMF